MRKSRRKPFIAIGAGVILLAILFFVLTGDGLWEGKEGSTNSVIEKKKVVFLTKSMDSSFWQSAYAVSDVTGLYHAKPRSLPYSQTCSAVIFFWSIL